MQDLIKQLAFPVLFILALFSLPVFERLTSPRAQVESTSERATPIDAADGPVPIKKIILMIGDGMGMHQVSQAVYARKLTAPDGAPLAFERLARPDRAHAAMVSTYSADSITTDSASSATAYACGIKTNNRFIGTKPNGRACESILDRARANGRATGLVSTMRITHATPASFFATIDNRDLEHRIAPQLLEDGGRVDVVLGGGSRFFLPDGLYHSDIKECKQRPRAPVGGAEKLQLELIDKSARLDEDTDLIAKARDSGYALACYKNQLPAPDSFQPGRDKLLGLFAGSNLPHIQERRVLKDFIPSLAEMTEYAIDVLDNDPDGFFLMVESGMIDYAGHYNDAGTQLQETLDFSRAIDKAIDYTERNPDTLLIVTADHETGGFSMSYDRSGDAYNYGDARVLERQLRQNASFQSLLGYALRKDIAGGTTPVERLLMGFQRSNQPWTLTRAEARAVFGISYNRSKNPDVQATEYPGTYSAEFNRMYFGNRLGRVIARQTKSVWSSGNHSHTPVGVFIQARGIDRAALPGWIENTDIYAIMRSALDSGRVELNK